MGVVTIVIGLAFVVSLLVSAVCRERAAHRAVFEQIDADLALIGQWRAKLAAQVRCDVPAPDYRMTCQRDCGHAGLHGAGSSTWFGSAWFDQVPA